HRPPGHAARLVAADPRAVGSARTGRVLPGPRRTEVSSMKGAKIGLLLVILAFGSTVETAWRIRNRIGPGAWGWFAGRHFQGPSFTFDAQQTEVVAASTPVEVENAFGAVNVSAGAPGEVRITLRKVVYLGYQEKSRALTDLSEIH